MKKKPAKHGGVREGSGRPAKLGRKSPLSVRLTPDVQEFLESILTNDSPQSEGVPSRSEFIDAAVRDTIAFKEWMKHVKSKK